MCVRAGSHAHAVVQLRSIERRSLRRVAGGHLHRRDELSGPGGGAEQKTPSALLTCSLKAAHRSLFTGVQVLIITVKGLRKPYYKNQDINNL